MIHADEDDLRQILEYIRNDQREDAYNLLQDLDTALRESVWNYLQ